MLTFTELRNDVDTLSEEEQDKLSAYSIMLRKSGEPGYDEQLTDRVGEDSNDSWIACEQVKD